MSDIIEGIRALEDRITKVGVVLTRVLEGDAALGVNALDALVGKKLDGTLSHLALNELGQVIVENSPDIEARLMMRGRVVNSAIGAVATVAEIPLLTNKVYRGLGVHASAARFSTWQVIHSDAGTDKVLLDSITSGQNPNYDTEFDAFEFVSGLTGTQKLKLVGINKEGIATDLSGTIITTEIQDT